MTKRDVEMRIDGLVLIIDLKDRAGSFQSNIHVQSIVDATLDCNYNEWLGEISDSFETTVRGNWVRGVRSIIHLQSAVSPVNITIEGNVIYSSLVGGYVIVVVENTSWTTMDAALSEIIPHYTPDLDVSLFIYDSQMQVIGSRVIGQGLQDPRVSIEYRARDCVDLVADHSK